MSLKLQRGSTLSNGKEEFLVLKTKDDGVELLSEKDNRIFMPWTETKKYEVVGQVQIDDLVSAMLEGYTPGTFQEL